MNDDPAHEQVDVDSSGPILITGMPRSGTTWLARLCAMAPGTALAGREPMNPRGRQYALAHTLSGWARLENPDKRQRRALRTAYTGLNPLVYSRYGHRQWAAPLPWTRLIVKDPFAVLSIPAISRTTHARTVVVYRHPGAMLASYRRMGWEPDLEELQPVLRDYRKTSGDTSPDVRDLPASGEVSEAEAMGRFWASLYAVVLHDMDAQADVVLVSHEELAAGGTAAGLRLFDTLGLSWGKEAAAEMAKESANSGAVQANQLHDFDRPPAQVATAWRTKLAAGELEAIEGATVTMRQRLAARRFALT